MLQLAYHESRPLTATSCVVFASPHSGRAYSRAFMERSILNHTQIRSSEDAFVDLLFEGVQDFGCYFLKARAPRAFLDLNREADALDPAVIHGITPLRLSPHVHAGLGVIPRVVAAKRAIYSGKIPLHEAQERIRTYWYPYHKRLKHLMGKLHRQHGQAILIDCHSMPNEATDAFENKGLARPDIVLGNRFGSSAHMQLMDQIVHIFQNQGFSVSCNTPFSGAYITKAYGNPERNRHVIQVEINRALYMDEQKIIPLAEFEPLRARLMQVAKCLSQLGRHHVAMAAE